MKVYEVYHSDYDEHSTYFICSSLEKADEAVRLFYLEYNSELSIKEWELDDLSNYLKVKPLC